MILAAFFLSNQVIFDCSNSVNLSLKNHATFDNIFKLYRSKRFLCISNHFGYINFHIHISVTICTKNVKLPIENDLSSDTCTALFRTTYTWFAACQRSFTCSKYAWEFRRRSLAESFLYDAFRFYFSSSFSYSSHICFCFRILLKLFFSTSSIFFLFFLKTKYRQRLFVVLLGKEFFLVRIYSSSVFSCCSNKCWRIQCHIQAFYSEHAMNGIKNEEKDAWT